MAKYTVQIRTLLENNYPIFDFKYPIFDEKYRGVLEQNILNSYYFREIGFETPGQFKHFLKTWMQINMPYYNRLYETELLITARDYNINLDNLTTRKVKTDQNSNNTAEQTSTNEQAGSATGTGSGTTKGKTTGGSTNQGDTVFSDTPQARLQGKDYATNLTEVDEAATHETNVDDTSTSTNNATSTSNGSALEKGVNVGKLSTIEEYSEHFLGNASMRYNAEIMEEWKKTWRIIDQQIIDELNQFFMGIY